MNGTDCIHLNAVVKTYPSYPLLGKHLPFRLTRPLDGLDIRANLGKAGAFSSNRHAGPEAAGRNTEYRKNHSSTGQGAEKRTGEEPYSFLQVKSDLFARGGTTSMFGGTVLGLSTTALCLRDSYNVHALDDC